MVSPSVGAADGTSASACGADCGLNVNAFSPLELETTAPPVAWSRMS
jgi:hypothetical protein